MSITKCKRCKSPRPEHKVTITVSFCPDKEICILSALSEFLELVRETRMVPEKRRRSKR